MMNGLSSTQQVLSYLGLSRPSAPDLAFVTRLLAAYVRTVPWGSVCRIARKASRPAEQRARTPAVFWQEAMQRGGDGTCFESNGAFFALLQHLGYSGYLTLNNMGEMVGCHSAVVLHIESQKWLVDVGLPIDAPIRLDDANITTAWGIINEYAAIPLGNNRFKIMCSHRPDPDCFTLIDVPIDPDAYWHRTVRDHDADGLFLDRVILRKIIDDAQWRYNGRNNTPQFEVFAGNAQKSTQPIEEDLAQALSARFGMDITVLQTALNNQD